MKRNVLKRVLAPALCALMVVGLSACGNNDVSTSKDPVPASKAFNAKTIWYEFSNKGVVDKDEKIRAVLSFDDNGKVTVYQCNDLAFSGLKDLKDEDIIKLAKKQDKALFDEKKKDALDRYQKEIDSATEQRDKYQKEYDNKTYDTPYNSMDSGHFKNNPEATQEWYKKELSPLKLKIDFYTAMKDKLNSIEYKEPEAVEFTLSGKTDKTGNMLMEETLSFPKYLYFNLATKMFGADFSNLPGGLKAESTTAADLIQKLEEEGKQKTADFSWDMLAFDKQTDSTELYPDPGVQTVYEMHFRGFGDFVMQVDEKQGGFTLDAADADGVQIDK